MYRYSEKFVSFNQVSAATPYFPGNSACFGSYKTPLEKSLNISCNCNTIIDLKWGGGGGGLLI